jgi:hypothetical protein
MKALVQSRFFSGEVASVIVITNQYSSNSTWGLLYSLSKLKFRISNQGEKVSSKQTIGRVRTNGDTGKTVIKFLLSQNTVYTNPQLSCQQDRTDIIIF